MFFGAVYIIGKMHRYPAFLEEESSLKPRASSKITV
jgi:hypothetical protein